MDQPIPYYCIIPSEVLLDKKLPPAARMLYGCIVVFSNKWGYARLNNETIANWFGVSVASVSAWLGALEEAGHLQVRSRTHRDRKLYPMVAVGKRQAKEVPEEKEQEEIHLSSKVQKSDATSQLFSEHSSSFLDHNLKENPKVITHGGLSPHKVFADLFFEHHRKTKGYDPPWSGKEAKLLKDDIARMKTLTVYSGEDWATVFTGLIQLFFKDKVKDVRDFAEKAGYTYAVFHSKIDAMMSWLDKRKEAAR